MNRWHITGNVIEHMQAPRLRIIMALHPDGSWRSESVEFVDQPDIGDNPQQLAQDLARLMREAGDAWREHIKGTP